MIWAGQENSVFSKIVMGVEFIMNLDIERYMGGKELQYNIKTTLCHSVPIPPLPTKIRNDAVMSNLKTSKMHMSPEKK